MRLRQFILLLIVITIYSIGIWFLISWPRQVVTNFDHVALICSFITAGSVFAFILFCIMGFFILLYDDKILPQNHWLNKKLW